MGCVQNLDTMDLISLYFLQVIIDRVHHSQLIECLERIGVDGKDVRIIANLYWQQKAAIKIEEELSPYIAIQRGVRQGCVLSPYLFNIYTEFIFREVEELEGININGKNINNIRYADDTALLAALEMLYLIIKAVLAAIITQ